MSLSPAVFPFIEAELDSLGFVCFRQRTPLAAHFMKNPDLVHPYYTINWWQDPDTRHINARGHQDLANLVASLVQDTACELVEIEEDTEDQDQRNRNHDEEDDDDDDNDTDDNDHYNDNNDHYNDNNDEQERLGMIMDRILTEHFKTQPSLPLYPASEFYGRPFDIQEQRELVAEDDGFWKDQPKDVKPWGPFQPAKHAEGKSGRLWEGVWPGDWQHGEVPRVSISLGCVSAGHDRVANLISLVVVVAKILAALGRGDDECAVGTTVFQHEEHSVSPDTQYEFRLVRPDSRASDRCFELTYPGPTHRSTWSHPDHPQKVYLKADEPGSKLTFDIETRLGTIKLYSLRSRTFGLGSIDCWVDDRKGDKVRADGWWDNGDLNIGRYVQRREEYRRR